MIKYILLVAVVLLSGCGDGDPVADDPILILNVKRGNSESLGRYRVSQTGVIADTGEGPVGGAITTNETVTIDKIADDGVTFTISLLNADGSKSSKQIVVPYDKEISVAVSKDATAKARLERK